MSEMKRTTPAPSSDELLHALTDGRLDDAQAAAAREDLDETALRTLHAWQAQRQALRALHAALPEEPLPPTLAAAARRLQARHARRGAGWRLGGLAATVLLAFGAGWVAHGAAPTSTAAAQLAQQAPAQRFALAATAAHAVFQPEVRHPVEVPASEQAQLLQWLSKRLDRPLRAPDLRVDGYTLMGGRLLPGDGGGTRAQFMYQDAAGERITVYLGALPPRGGTPDETAFRFERDGSTSAFYWTDGGFGYALVGSLPRERLQTLATRVHQQLP